MSPGVCLRTGLLRWMFGNSSLAVCFWSLGSTKPIAINLLHEQFQQRPIPESIHLVGPRVAARGCDLRRRYRSLPLLKGEGANLWHLAFEIKYRRCDASSGAFARFIETVSEKSVARRWNRARSGTLEGRVGLGCPSAEVGEEDAQIH